MPPQSASSNPNNTAVDTRWHLVSRHFPVILFAILSGVVLYEAATTLTEQGHASGSAIRNAALYPRLLAGLLLFLVFLQVISDFRLSGPVPGAEEPAEPGQDRLTVFAALTLVAYIILLPIMGFLLTTPVFVLAFLLLLGDRNWRTLSFVPMATTAGCFVVFQMMFNVNLPRGLFGLALNF
ncbi:tripartite tricarboxylate transporter TctB family protein [Pelagovum sp. HNIBRBA483]|uniref:tripartite tricarboxylate transporter TctB family protein n=1 Tax=Pelagovum sp. HNIBRBA483 TaxID=3233341 RepID=UPI0034A10D0A